MSFLRVKCKNKAENYIISKLNHPELLESTRMKEQTKFNLSST